MSRVAGRIHLGLTILACFGGGSLYGWSGYLPAVRAQFSVGNALASLVFSLALVSFTAGVLLGPALLAKVGAGFRVPLLAGCAALCLGVAGLSPVFAGFAILYGLCFGFVAGALYNHALTAASASGSAAVLLPVSVAAFGLGGAVFGPVQVWLTALGWGLWSVVPALSCLAIAALFALVVPPVCVGQRPRQVPPGSLIAPDRALVVLGLIFATGSCPGLIVLGLAAQILSSGAAGVGLTSLAVFLAATGNTLGRLSAALSARRFGPARGIVGALVVSLITLCGLAFTTTPGVVVGLLFGVAFAYGQLAATMPLLVRSEVSGPAFSSAFGWVFIGWGVAGLLGPWSAGWLLDATGTVQVSLILCIALTACSLWLMLRFTPVRRWPKDC